MNIYPAIDIKGGEAVRLYQGQYDKVTVYQRDPVALAQSFAEQGATFLHVVDLDGAKAKEPVHVQLIEAIAYESGLHIQTGGGIRKRQQVCTLFNKGVTRVVLGSIAISEPQIVKEWFSEFGADRFVLALDVRLDENAQPMLAMHGWQTQSKISLWKMIEEYQAVALKHILCTDIHVDGTMQGPNLSLYQECAKRYPGLQFQASGGIGSLDDIRQLASIPMAGVVVGKAIYEQRFTLRSALDEVSSC